MKDEKLTIAKKLMKKIKPYFDEEKNELKADAPENIKKAYKQLTELVDAMMEDEDLFSNTDTKLIG